jgi:hypothetical protein
MSNLYKKLNCGNLRQINQEIMAYVDSKKFDGSEFWNPVDMREFMQATPQFTVWWLDNQLAIKNVAVTFAIDSNCCEPHTDTPPSIYKLSWPVLNTEHTWNRWFKPNPECGFEINTLGGTSYLDMNQLEEIDRMQVDSPAIIATGVPHDVWFDSNAVYPRIGLQCQLFLEPQSL